MTFIIDRSWQRLSPTSLLAGSPLTLFRVTPAGAAVLDALERGDDPPAGHQPLTARLTAAGAAHPDPPPDGPHLSQVSVVIPAFAATIDDRERIVRLAASFPGVAAVIVVDDASPAALSGGPGQQVIRHRTNQGPGAARNTGLAAVATPIVLFVDSDATIDVEELPRLLAHLADPQVALAAPRIRSRAGDSLLARYDRGHSPLDMGVAPGRVSPGTRISYVPAAVLACRTVALRAIGGFEPALRLGEDVDLVWRLVEAGHACRYVPASTAEHEPRTSFAAWLLQRVGYGSSAAALAARHPGAVPPLRMNRWSAAAWALTAAGHPLLGTGTAAGTTVALVRKLGTAAGTPWRTAWRIAGLGHLHAGRQLAEAATGAWWPITAAAALLSRRARRAALLAAAVPVTLDWIAHRRATDPAIRIGLPSFAALRLADRAAYGTGVWQGALQRRDLSALRPDLT